MTTRMPLVHKASTIAFKYLAPAIGWGIFVSIMSLTPGDKLPDALVSLNDKMLHGGIYFFSALLIYLAFIRYDFNNKPSKGALWFIVIICAVFGGLIEVAQYYLIPNRKGDWADFLANTIGAVLCVLIMRVLHHYFSLRR